MILLDTHTWLWWLHTQELLSDRGRTLLTIGENQNALMVSAISARGNCTQAQCWEITTPPCRQ